MLMYEYQVVNGDCIVRCFNAIEEAKRFIDASHNVQLRSKKAESELYISFMIALEKDTFMDWIKQNGYKLDKTELILIISEMDYTMNKFKEYKGVAKKRYINDILEKIVDEDN